MLCNITIIIIILCLCINTFSITHARYSSLLISYESSRAANVTGHTNGTDARHVRAIAGWPGRESSYDVVSGEKDATEEKEMDICDGDRRLCSRV